MLEVMRHLNSFATGENTGQRKVWLLLGGDPEGADASLKAGVHVALQLSKFSDLQ
ncbi:hypothetical protein HaLaN_20008, partial [Haematococcus lacustris]